MSATATNTTAFATKPSTVGVFASVFDVLIELGETSRAADAARTFARLNAMTDAQLAERNISRDEIFGMTFGRLGTI